MAGQFVWKIRAVFESVSSALLAALIGTAFLYLLWRNWTEARNRAARRAGFLDDAKTLFEGGLKSVKPDGFPRISGTYRGLTFDLQAVPDTLNIRKLPALWLLVSLPERLPLPGTFDMMMRPRGVEIFSKHADLPVQIAPDPMFPHDCAIRTDNPAALPDREVLARHLGLFDDPLAKELVISPKGVRIVWLAEEANRGRYLIFRDSEMGLTPFPAGSLKPLLDYLVALHADLSGPTR